jgi:hypothetical protein
MNHAVNYFTLLIAFYFFFLMIAIDPNVPIQAIAATIIIVVVIESSSFCEGKTARISRFSSPHTLQVSLLSNE